MGDEMVNERFLDAVRLSDATVCKTLLKAGAAVDAPDGQGRSPLQTAVSGGRSDICQILIAGGADVTRSDQQGRSPLWWAAAGSRWDVCTNLLNAGANPAAADHQGMTPLHWAASRGTVSVCTAMIDAGGLISAADADGITPLHEAARAPNGDGATACVQRLLAAGADPRMPDIDGDRPIDFARGVAGRDEIVTMLETRTQELNLRDRVAARPMASSRGSAISL